MFSGCQAQVGCFCEGVREGRDLRALEKKLKTKHIANSKKSYSWDLEEHRDNVIGYKSSIPLKKTYANCLNFVIYCLSTQLPFSLSTQGEIYWDNRQVVIELELIL